ncbi:MAG: EAL domain-containing protein [Desulfovibrionaceae bacterium]|nr:EAL domain-containing protein [Desulfovibrionaceae bacterium]
MGIIPHISSWPATQAQPCEQGAPLITPVCLQQLFSLCESTIHIENLLAFLGTCLHAERLCIINTTQNTVHTTHEWLASSKYSQPRTVCPLPPHGLAFAHAHKVLSVFFGYNAAPFPHSSTAATPTAFIACPLEQNHVLVGILLIEHYHACPWGTQEAEPLGIVRQCIATALFQQNALRALLTKRKNIHNLLNIVPSPIFVIEPHSYALLYMNAAIARTFPQARLGMACYRAFWGKNHPCSFCPTLTLGTKRNSINSLPDRLFGAKSEIHCSQIQWEDNQSAYAMLVIQHGAEEKEYKNQLCYQVFAAAMHSVYDYIFDIDLSTGKYDLISLQLQVQQREVLTGTYQEDVKLVDKYVHPLFHAQFKGLFSLEGMRKGKPAELEYLCLTLQGYRWKRRQSFPYSLADGNMHVLSLVHDIHESKLAALAKTQEENSIKIALRNSYTRVFLLHVRTGEFTYLVKSNEAARTVDLVGDFATDIKHQGNSFVHPHDRKAFFEFYSLETIRKAIQNTTKLSLEYRSLDKNNCYRWNSSLIEPLPHTPHKVMLLIHDITQRRALEEKRHELEVRYATVFKQSCDICFEINLTSGLYKRTVFTGINNTIPATGHYAHLITAFLGDLLHPEDQTTFLQLFSLEALRTAYYKQNTSLTAHYRLHHPDVSYRWKEARLSFFLENNDPIAIILVHDIHHQKLLEQEKYADQQRFDLAIRTSYCEIYTVNLHKNIWTRCFSTGLLTDISAVSIAERVHAAIHPHDRQRVLAAYTQKNLQDYIAQHSGEVFAEYRRLSADGSYYWVSATFVATKKDVDQSSCALLLLQDIHEKKMQEQRQHITKQYGYALRKRYDVIDEIDVTNQSHHLFYRVENTFVTPPENGSLPDLIAFFRQSALHPEDVQRFDDFFQLTRLQQYFAAGGEFLIEEVRRRWVDGSYRWASLTIFPVHNESHEHTIYLLFTMDISAQKKAEEISRQNALLARQRLGDERYRTILEQTDTLVFEWWEGIHKQFVPIELTQRFAGTYDERNLLQIWQDDEVIAPEDTEQLNSLIATLHHGSSHATMTVRFRLRRGGSIWCRVAISCTCDVERKATRFIGTLNDVDAATKSLMELRFRSEYDVLTKLYNMSAFYAHATKLLQSNARARYCVVRMDIDRFKVINDLYGLAAGDALLQFIAESLRRAIGKKDICGRISGDIFCILAAGYPDEMVNMTAAISARLEQYPLPYKIKPSFGICAVSNSNIAINVLCDWANLALTTVKGNYARNYAFYSSQLRDKMLEEKRIENRMHQALLEGQFVLYLQPKVDIATSRIVGAEGLVRWLHPVDGIISPNRFIPLFEKNGFILQLDTTIWEQACQVIQRWLLAGFTPPPVSINMSRAHIHDPLLIDKLEAMTQKYQVPPALLELEITESAFLENESTMYSTINRLRQKGFLFSMDDFGSGYSSLNVLKNIPVDYIKIDRGFLNEVSTTEKGKTVIRYSIAMAKEMNIGVIAEGVENAEQAAFLLQAGCRYAQGYLYSRPVPVHEFENLFFHQPQPPFPLDAEVAHIAKHMPAQSPFMPK